MPTARKDYSQGRAVVVAYSNITHARNPHSFPAGSLRLRRTTIWGKWGKTECRGGCYRPRLLCVASALLSHQRAYAARLQRCLIPRLSRGVCCEHLTCEELVATVCVWDSSLLNLERCCRQAACLLCCAAGSLELEIARHTACSAARM